MRAIVMIPAILAATGAGGATARAADAPDPQAQQSVQAMFGNTVVSMYPDGRSQKVWLHADGTWEGLSRKGKPLAGRWTMRADKVCLRQSKPPTLPISFCQVLPKDTDATLTSRDLTGQTIHLKLVKGITESGG